MISVWTSSLLTWLYIWEKSLKSLSSSASFLASDYYIEGFAVNDSVYFLKALGPVSSAMVEWLSGLMLILLSLFFFLAKSKWGIEIHLLHNYLIWIDLLRSWEIVLIIKSYPILHTFTTVPIRGRCQWRNSYPDFFIRSIFYWRFLSIIWSLLQRAFLVQHSLSQSSIINRLLLQLVKLAIQLLHQW